MIDVVNLADYMLLSYYSGNTWDWNPTQNWMAGGPKTPGAGGWKFYNWGLRHHLAGRQWQQSLQDGCRIVFLRF